MNCRSPPLARGACRANRPRPIAALAGVVVPAGQRGPLVAGKTTDRLLADLLMIRCDVIRHDVY